MSVKDHSPGQPLANAADSKDAKSDGFQVESGEMVGSEKSSAARAPVSGITRFFTGPELEARKARYREADMLSDEIETDATAAGGEGGAEKAKQSVLNKRETSGLKRDMGWKGCAWNITAYSIALGVLSLPNVAATVGIVPYIFLILIFAYLTWFTGISYWHLQQRYPGIHSLEDAGHLLFGRPGRVIFGTLQYLFSICLAGNHVLLGAKAFSRLGWHAPETCAIALYFTFTVISFLFTLPRSYKLFSYLAVVSVCCITVVIIITMIAANISGPVNQPAGSPEPGIRAFGSLLDPPPTFLQGMLGVSNLFVSFGASPTYLPVMAEMHNPKRDFPRALAFLAIFQIVVYLLVGGVVERGLGQYVESPSLASLSPVMSKIGYGIGLPTILLAGCASGQVAAKHIYVKLGRTQPSLFRTKARGWSVWIFVNIINWILAWILAECIPFFSSFLGVESSAFWTAFLAFGAAFMLFCAYDDKLRVGGKAQISGDADLKAYRAEVLVASTDEEARTQHSTLLRWACTIPSRPASAWTFALVVWLITSLVCITGMWGAALSIRDSYAQGVVGRPFSCAITDA
ncbi:hypothetical protein CBOM_00961 [Ceraceosorus bombacis]|uniref:Amino acid transporter transmembrane domain-containing protein n=1 Tax=Ceraceosorus bombacis TaxID=401625 RepID=A0A0P1BCH5_9BASI|nr:hypothetical protein CBOM_00961 [Ceraceosorus bombacis]